MVPPLLHTTTDTCHTLRVNKVPSLIHTGIPPPPHQEASRPSEGAGPDLCLGRIRDGLLSEEPTPLIIPAQPQSACPTQLGHINQGNGFTFIPFTQGAHDEPTLTLHDRSGHPYSIYIDTGAEADLVPRRLLDLSFPAWRRRRTQSRTKLMAANNTAIPHEGRVVITLPLPETKGLKTSYTLEINPFIINAPNDTTTIILGYPSLKAHGLIPVPGSGLLCTGSPLHQHSGTTLGPEISAHKISITSRSSEADAETDHVTWEARPSRPYVVHPYKRVTITLNPKSVQPAEINEKNGSKVLARRCPCILVEECDTCLRTEGNVQICSLLNGTISFVIDNTSSPTSYIITPKDPFYISFQTTFDLGDVAKTAINSIQDLDFEIDAPTNPYSDLECKELFQKTREEVTATLRSIAAEPESWSLAGLRPATLRLIGSDGKAKSPDRGEGDPIPLDLFSTVNPCSYCKKASSSFCNLGAPDCELRKFSRRFELPDSSTSAITHHEDGFSPTCLPRSPTLVVGCHRDLNHHESSWRSWFPNEKAPPGTTLILHRLHDAVVTEVTKAHLLEVARHAEEHNISEIHFTNYAAYGTSENLLLRCIPNHASIHLHHSNDIEVAGPAHDPRRRGAKPPTPPHHPLTGPSASQGPPFQQDCAPPGPIMVEPGLPKPIHALRPEGDFSKVSILTTDPDLMRRCKEVLLAHDKVFAKSSTDVGQFVDSHSGRPYLFQVRLKGLPPPRHKTRFVSPAKEEAASQLVAALLANNVVKRRFSPYNSQSVYVAKKRKQLTLEEHINRGNPASTFIEGTLDTQAPLQLRLCIDMAAANKNIVQDNLCSLSPKALVQRLSGWGSSASLDLANAYHCLTLSDSSEMISGWESGIPSMPSRMVFCRAQMGMACSAKWLEAGLAKTLAQAHGKYLRYADDIIIVGKDDEDVLANLSNILDLLASHGWKIKQEKLTVFAKQLLVFGLKVDLEEQRVSIPRADLDAVLLRARPASPAELRSFNGSIAWFAENLGHHAHATALLHRMTRKDGVFAWTEENLQAYETLQEFMSKPAVYTSLPNFDLPFHMVSDSSEHATGCLLLQLAGPEDLRIISYKSHIHDLRTSRLSSHERESYSMIYCVSSFYDIISGRPSTIYSDSQASVLLSLMSRTNSKVARWLCLLRSLPFLRVCWISSKTPILRLCDYLSRRPATARNWKNKRVDSEDIEKVTLAASKLRRDTLMSLAHHDVLIDYVCHLPQETLEEMSNETLYVDHHGNVRSSDTDEPQHAPSPGETKTPEVDSPDPPAHLNHPAFLTRQDAKPASDHPAGEGDVLQGKPHQVQSPESESGLVQNNEDMDLLLQRISTTTPYAKPRGPSGSHPRAASINPDGSGMAGRGRLTSQASLSMTPKRASPSPTPHATSVYRVKTHHLNNNVEDPLIYPANLLSTEEADDLGLLDPAPRHAEGPVTITVNMDKPQSPATHDKEGKFLSLCFELSPWMRLSALRSSQDSDPKLKSLKMKCQDGPFTKGDATYMLKEGVLLRRHARDKLETLQICLSRASGYMLSLKAHLGSGKGTYRHSLGPALHHSPKKMVSLISSRFYFDNMLELCKQISECCFICQEGKHSVAASRKDAHRRVITPSAPAQAWSVDLLELPSSGGKGGKLLTGMDLFSNFGVAICIDQAPTSEYLFDLISWQIFSFHGRPHFILADNASYFRSAAFKEATTQLNIELRTIPAYSAKSSPVEHLNKLIIKHLRLLHQHHNIPHSEWRRTLPHVMNGINWSPYGGPMGQIHHLSPARVFYGDTRQSLDPSARFDLPFLAHRFTNHADFVRRVADANWAVQQVIAEHRDALQRSRLQTKEDHNQRFDSIRSYRMGDVVLFDRKLPPGVSSKLRPRASYRFVVLGETDSCVYVRPWSSGSIDKWLSAQKITKQSKESVALLPLIKLPKERTRLDKSLHLYSSNSRIPERHLLQDMCLPDPEPIQVEVEEYGPTEDWLETLPPHHATSEVDEDATALTTQEPTEGLPLGPNPVPPQLPPSEHQTYPQTEPVLAPATGDPEETSDRAPPRTHHNRRPKKGILKRQGLRRSRRLQKTCRFSSTVSHDDGTSTLLHSGPSPCFRVFTFPPSNNNPMEDLDREFLGSIIGTPAGEVHIPPPKLFDRKCACKMCRKQLPSCRSAPCRQCTPI